MKKTFQWWYHKAFTLIEMLIAMTIFFLMITTVTSIFVYVYKTKWWLEARQNLTKESYFFLEKLQVMIKDYTIDYEEYRNRQQTWCTAPNALQRSTTGHCTMMTYYGNRNVLATSDTDDHENNTLYYWSTTYPNSNDSISSLDFDDPNYIIKDDQSVDTAVASAKTTLTHSSQQSSWFIQSYGQYKVLFTDVKDDVDFIPGPVGDDDDRDMGRGPGQAVYFSGDIYPQELYLISKDGTRRMFFRRKLLDLDDLNGDDVVSPSERLYSIQVLQLRWFDAWAKHDFDGEGVYDGTIDTWACDYGLWYVCAGVNLDWVYSGYRLPAHIDDGRQDMLWSDITIAERNIRLHPLVNPYLSWDDDDAQIAPVITINFLAHLYGKNRSSKIPWSQMDSYIINLQTSFSTLP